MPASSGVQVQSLPVHGRDDRVLLSWNSATFRPIVRLIRRDGSLVCSGVVVAPTLLLTSAHCTTYRDERFDSKSADGVAFAETSSGRRFGIRRSCIAPEYSGRRDEHGRHRLDDVTPDLAVLTTYEPIGEATGWLSVSPSLRDGEKVLLAGFHEDAPDSLRGSRCAAERWDSPWVYDHIAHRCFAKPGSSGSPILIRRNGGYAIAGVHSASDGSRGFAALVGGERLVDNFLNRQVADNFARAKGSREVLVAPADLPIMVNGIYL